MQDNSNGSQTGNAEQPRGKGDSGFFKERLLRDADNVTDRDMDELEREVPKKISSFELKALAAGTEWIGTMLERVKALYSLLRDREYKMSVKNKALIAAALLYFVMPADVIPDFIPGIGYIDDAMVLGVLWKMIGEEVEAYMSSRRGLNAPAGE
ncbi:MAG: YkvA family protein [Bacteroidota bacterium]